MVDSKAIWSVVDSLKSEDKTTQHTTQAVVNRIDNEGRVWVSIPGGETETPTETSDAEVKRGDNVTVEWRGGKLYVLGNSSNPSVGAQRVNEIDQLATQAYQSANEASNNANIAKVAADNAQTSADNAATAAATADQKATAASSAASQAQTDAAAAQTAASNAQTAASSAQTSAQQAVQDAATAGRAASVAQAAAEAAQGDIDEQQEWFWHDTNGSHVLGATSGYRNDIDSTGMTIVETATEESVARFGVDGATIGKTDETHADIDYHSLQLVDKEGSTFFHVSDMRDKDDDYQATITEVFQGDGTQTEFSVGLPVSNDVSATDSSDPSNTATRSTRKYTFQTAPASGATVTIVYKTKSIEAKAYTFGIRGRGNIGPLSVAEGLDNIASGFYSHAEGYVTTANGRYSHAQGSGSTASGDESHAEGHGTTASGGSSHAEGSETTASGDNSHSEGGRSIASGQCSHAEGFGTTASGEQAHAEGVNTTASGDYSHAEGAGSTASGGSSHAEGSETTASGQYSHAEGADITASGYASHAEGFDTTASGYTSHAQNYKTIAQRRAQTALGEYNIADTGGTDETTRGDYAVIVGNGTGESNRSNALTIDWSGNTWAAGNITDGSGNVLSDKVDATDVYTKTEVDTALADKADTTDLANYLPLTGGTLEGGTGTYALTVNDGTDDTLTIDWDGNTWASGTYTAETSTGEAFFKSIRSDTGAELDFGVGAGGNNRGIFDNDMNDWALFWDNDGTGYLRSKASSGVNTWALGTDAVLTLAPNTTNNTTAIQYTASWTNNKLLLTSKNNAYDLTTSSAAAPSATARTIFAQAQDKNGNWVGAIQHNAYSSGSSYTEILAQRWNSSTSALVNNALQVGVDANGKRYYNVSDPAAFRSELGLTFLSYNTVANWATANTNFTFSSGTMRKNDIMARFTLAVKTTNALTSGTGYIVGTLKAGYRPVMAIFGGSTTNVNLSVRVTAAGEIVVIPRQAISAGTTIYIGTLLYDL